MSLFPVRNTMENFLCNFSGEQGIQIHIQLIGQKRISKYISKYILGQSS